MSHNSSANSLCWFWTSLPRYLPNLLSLGSVATHTDELSDQISGSKATTAIVYP
jgi:hypothetical protein